MVSEVVYFTWINLGKNCCHEALKSHLRPEVR